ncbi:Protein YIPF1-like protein [Bienertia sinuspersici]
MMLWAYMGLHDFGLCDCCSWKFSLLLNRTSSWNFDVSFMSLAASTVYGYAIVVPLAFYFLLQYLGSPASVVRFWCMWGYSLFIFVLCCLVAFQLVLLPQISSLMSREMISCWFGSCIYVAICFGTLHQNLVFR